MTIHSDLLQLKQLNSMEISIYFIFKTIKCDRSTWPARRKVDRSTPNSVRTLSVDRPLFRALPTITDQQRPLLTINDHQQSSMTATKQHWPSVAITNHHWIVMITSLFFTNNIQQWLSFNITGPTIAITNHHWSVMIISPPFTINNHQ